MMFRLSVDLQPTSLARVTVQHPLPASRAVVSDTGGHVDRKPFPVEPGVHHMPQASHKLGCRAVVLDVEHLVSHLRLRDGEMGGKIFHNVSRC